MEMEIPTTEEDVSVSDLKQFYALWDMRVVILFSFILQVFLILSAPFRKRSSHSFLMVPMWLAYLLSSAIATFGIGQISYYSSCSSAYSHTAVKTRILHAFWSTFFLLHTGAPDTITAYALEDNDLWIRHFFQLGFNTGTCAYIIFLQRAIPKNSLFLPTLLIFFAGLIKYSERICCLFLASSARLQSTSLGEPDPGPSYDKHVDYFIHKKRSHIPSLVETIAPRTSRLPDQRKKPTSLRDLDVVVSAHRFYHGSKGLIVDLVLNSGERKDSRLFFWNRTPRDAFRVVEVELNFFYDILFTKAVVVHSRYGCALRFVSFACSVASYCLFHYRFERRGLHKFDVGVTYFLLRGAIFLELIAFLKVLLSDWTVVSLSGSDDWPLCVSVASKILNVKLLFGWLPRIITRKWPESISQYNLIGCCLNPCSRFRERLIGPFGLMVFVHKMKYVWTEKWNDKLRNFIFEELKMKSELADDLETLRDLYTAKGDWVLQFESQTQILPWITEVDFDESLLLWHVATDLLWYVSDPPLGSDLSLSPKEIEFRSLAKILSDYMLYLLVFESPILSSVIGNGHQRFQDTRAEAKKFLNEKNKLDLDSKKVDFSQKEACLTIWNVETEFRSGSVKGDGSKSVLFDGCILAKELDELEVGKWEIICKVWVEMLCHAACRCKGRTHVEQLGKGGQLITLVWMLMSHFGLGNQFQISDFRPRTALTVAK